VSKQGADVAALTRAISEDPAYAPHPKKPKPAVKPRKKKWLERIRERRRRRRARRGR